MHVQFWGAARTVTGSMHLLEIGGHRMLLDCGTYQGKRQEAYERNRHLPFDATSIEAVVLSHAHQDHCGNLPTLVRAGFQGKIYCTSATRDLCAYMLMDSAHIQESDAAYVNKRRMRQGQTPFEPLYTQEHAMLALKRFVAIDYEHAFEPVPGVAVTFRDAGHILGSAIVIADLTEGERQRRLLFSGDLGRQNMAILRDPQTAPDVDYVIMESTYGNRLHESTGEAAEALRTWVNDAFQRRGKLLIPCFALGRTQEIIFRLNQMWNAQQLPAIDVYVDSPLATNLTEVFRLHPECYDAEMADALVHEPDGDPLGFSKLRYTRTVDDSKRLNTLDGPAVIISASGMCEAGRILHHLANHVSDPSTTVLFVGFQAQDTLGRRILDGASPIRIFGEVFDVHANIQHIDGYSAHADRHDLLTWAGSVAHLGHVKQTFLVHGEMDAMTALAEGLRTQGATGVEIPDRGQVFEIL